MKKVLSIMLSVSLLMGSAALSGAALPSDAALADRTVAHTLYVAVSGDDATGDGSADRPFATIQKAKDAVRALDKTQGDIVVKIGDGVYELSQTLVFDERDSGADRCTIYYEAAGDTKPVISGGRRVRSAWEKATDVTWLKDGLIAYKTPWTRDSKLRALYVNGQRAAMTKRTGTPLGAVGTYTVTKGQADWAWIGGSQSTGNVFAASFGLPL